MPTAIGIFISREQAENAVHELLAAKVPQEEVSLLTPEASHPEHRTTGKKVGAYVGGAIGTSTGLTLGMAAATLAVPGIGPVVALGLGAAALLGFGGITAGRSVGAGIDELNEAEHLSDVPDAAFFRNVLSQNRSVIVVQTENDDVHVRASAILNRFSFGAKPDPSGSAGRVSSHRVRDVFVISLSGRIVGGDPTAALREIVGQAIDLGATKFLIEMSGVIFLDSSGVGELVNSLLRVRTAGGQLKLTRLPDKIAELMHITHLDKVMDIQADEARAFATFG